MDMPQAINMVINKTDLDQEQMAGVMRTIMTGGATPSHRLIADCLALWAANHLLGGLMYGIDQIGFHRLLDSR